MAAKIYLKNKIFLLFLFLLTISLFSCSEKSNHSNDIIHSNSAFQSEVIKKDTFITLDLSFKNIKGGFNIDSFIDNSDNIDSLILSDNLISYIEKSPKNLTYLSLSNNQLQEHFFLKEASKLKYLDVSNNQLGFIILKGEIHLINLYANNNTGVILKFNYFDSLKYINMSNTKIAKPLLEKLEKIGGIKIDLTNTSVLDYSFEEIDFTIE